LSLQIVLDFGQAERGQSETRFLVSFMSKHLHLQALLTFWKALWNRKNLVS
jgi:hypothetical protein